MKATERTVPFQARSLTAMGLAGKATVSRQPARASSDPSTTARAGALAPVQAVKDGVAVVGVSWPAGAAVSATDTFQIRTLTGATWSAWQTLDRDESHGADGAEAAAAHQATQPYVVAGASSFEVRALAADGTAPTQASVEVVDPGTSAADSDVAATPPGSAAAAAGKPTIYTRAQWGADESIRKGSPEYGQVQVGFVHHTDGTNSYTASQVPSIIRGIYAYHVNGNGWNDIGYNFLVDKFGRIWEGRYGGMDRSVVGAHTIGYNSWSFGASAIGNFQSTVPSSAMVDAYKRLFAWKLSLSGLPVYGTVSTNGHTFNRVSGHRDEAPTFSTSCPGDQLYARLSSVRAGASALMGTLTPSSIQRNVDRSGTSDVLSYAGTLTPSPVNGSVTVLKSASPQPVRAGVAIGSGWNVLRGATLTPDLTGDGRADVVAQDPQGNRLRIYAGNGRGGFAGVAYKGTGWNVMSSVLAAGDRDRDGRNDLLAVNKNGDLTFYPGDGRGWVSGGQVIGRGWTTLSSITPAGDLNGDGWPDLLATRRSDGAQVMYAGSAGGGVKQGVVWGRGWNTLTAVVGGADLDTDGRPDVIARDGSGHMRTYYSGTGGALQRTNFWGSGWGGATQLSSGADFDGDGHADVLAVFASSSGGSLRLYPGTGNRDFVSGSAFPTVAGADLVRLVGDVNGDGYVDAVARIRTTDRLVLLKGQSGGSFAAPVVIGAGWNTFNLVEPAGDLDYDGVPDLMARTTGGTLYLYPMTRALGFKPRMTIGTGWGSMTDMVGTGAFNADANGDVVALRSSDHALVLYRGAGPAPLQDSFVLVSGQSDLAQIVGVNDFNGDGHRDVLARSTTGALWLYPGNGTGGLSSARQPVLGGEGAGHVLG